MMDGQGTNIQLFVNGEKVDTSQSDPGESLVNFLRKSLCLTGTKFNCHKGCSGACTVLLTSWRYDLATYWHRTISACATPLAALHRTNVTTIEGIGTSKHPHHLQSRLADCHGVQCGYASPGTIMSMFGLLVVNSQPSLAEIEKHVSGNLCRCTGYRSMLEAFKIYTETPDKSCREKVESNLPHGMKVKDASPPVFRGAVTWYVAQSSSLAKSLHKKHPEAKVVYGIPHPDSIGEVVIDASHMEKGNNKITKTKKGLEIAACVTLTEMRAHLEEVEFVGTTQYRNVTALADALAESPDLRTILLAAGTTATTLKSKTVSLEKVLARSVQDVVLESFTIPLRADSEHLLFYRVANRKAYSNPVVTTAFNVRMDGDKVKSSSIFFGGSGSKESKANNVIKFMEGKDIFNFSLSKAKDAVKLDVPQSAENALFQNIIFKFIEDLKTVVKTPANSQKALKGLRYHKRFEIESTQFKEIQHGLNEDTKPLGKPLVHRAAIMCTTGEAKFVDDIPSRSNELFLAFVRSTKGHAKLVNVDPSRALAVPGVKLFISAKDIPDALKNYETFGHHDENVFAEDEVLFVGHHIGAVIAVDEKTARKAAEMVDIKYEDLQVITTIDEAIAAESYIDPKPIDGFNVGDVESAFASSDHVIEGEIQVPRQEHFYEETYNTICVPGENNEMDVYLGTPNALMTHTFVAGVLEVPFNRIVMHVKRVGDSFGGKGLRGIPVTMAVAKASQLTGQPVRCTLTREEDMKQMGQRGEFKATYKVGVTDGKLTGVKYRLWKNAGYNSDMSPDILACTLVHLDNSYRFPSMDCSGKICKTNTPSNTANRAYGAPPAMSITENMLTDVTMSLGLDPIEFRKANMYKGGEKTHYGQVHKEQDLSMELCMNECIRQSNYKDEKAAVEDFNVKNKWRKRGIALQPNKYGVGFPPPFNQATALLNIFLDGSVSVYVGGVELGQGLHTKVMQIAAHELGIPISKIYMAECATDKNPIPNITGGSSACDFSGNAVRNACAEMNKRLAPVKEAASEATWEQWVGMAFGSQINLSVHAHYSPDNALTIYDWEKKEGNRWAYFTTGAACSVVEVDVLTGEHTLLKVNIVMDVGESINPAIDLSQIEGAFIQGYGYLSMENCSYSETGELLTPGPATYNMPTVSDLPSQFNVSLLRKSKEEGPRLLYSSKGIGEAPFFNGTSVYFALKDAIFAARKDAGISGPFKLDTPAIPQNVLKVCLSSPFN